MDIELQLLLPPSPILNGLKSFTTRLPMFKHFLGDLGPHIVFGILKLIDSSSAVTVDVRALDRHIDYASQISF
jgi:hypothetical protein